MKGEITIDGEQKKQLAEAKPYRTWLASNRIELNELKSGRKVPHNVDNYNSMLRTFGFSKEDVEKIILPMASNGAEPVSAMGNDTPLAVLSDKPQLLYNYFRQQFAQVTNPPIDPIREELADSAYRRARIYTRFTLGLNPLFRLGGKRQRVQCAAGRERQTKQISRAIEQLTGCKVGRAADAGAVRQAVRAALHMQQLTRTAGQVPRQEFAVKQIQLAG